MRILEQETNEIQVHKTFVIGLSNGEKIVVDKWTGEEFMVQDGYSFKTKDDQLKFDKMTDEQQDKLDDFIMKHCYLYKEVKTAKQEFNEALSMLHHVEDRTRYKNKKLAKAINLLQIVKI